MFISIVVVRGILSELENRDIDPDDVLRASGLRRERILDIHQYLTLDELERLVGNALERTKDPGLGLAVGVNSPETMLQVFGHLLRAQSTLREAFASWQRYSVLITDALNFALREQDDLALFTCEPCTSSPSLRFFMDLTLTVTVRFGGHFARGWGDLREVHFRHATPSDAPRYREAFACPVRFGQEHNALIFPRELLDRPQLLADETMRSVLHEAVEGLLRKRTQTRTLSDRVRCLLHTPEELARADADTIARHLNVNVRTLRRRLAAEGTALAALVDEARCQFACRALSRPAANVKEISELLDFSEPSAFHRAFKRWTGRTPNEYARIAAAKRPAGKLARSPSHETSLRTPHAS